MFDLIVIGGGPAASTVSTLVALQGHRVLLLEKERFPRYQIDRPPSAPTRVRPSAPDGRAD